MSLKQAHGRGKEAPIKSAREKPAAKARAQLASEADERSTPDAQVASDAGEERAPDASQGKPRRAREQRTLDAPKGKPTADARKRRGRAGGVTLEGLRGQIDAINLRLVELFNHRARLAQEIGRLKHADGAPIYQPVRERQVLDRVVANNPGPLSGDHLRRIFQELISACTALEHVIRVAYLGPEHTYSHEAARNRFGTSAAFVPQASIAAVFQALENERADYGVVPVENSTEGSVSLTLDLLIDTPLKIIGEVLLPVRHALMARADAGGFGKIVSHQQSLGQCRNYLAANYPNCELEAAASTGWRRSRRRRLRGMRRSRRWRRRGPTI